MAHPASFRASTVMLLRSMSRYSAPRLQPRSAPNAASGSARC